MNNFKTLFLYQSCKVELCRDSSRCFSFLFQAKQDWFQTWIILPNRNNKPSFRKLITEPFVSSQKLPSNMNDARRRAGVTCAHICLWLANWNRKLFGRLSRGLQKRKCVAPTVLFCSMFQNQELSAIHICYALVCPDFAVLVASWLIWKAPMLAEWIDWRSWIRNPFLCAPQRAPHPYSTFGFCWPELLTVKYILYI